MIAYPKYLYHSELEPVVVESPEEEDALGDGWEDSPAKHGVITNPSAEQARKIAQDNLAKEAKRRPGRPAKEE